MRRSGRSLRSFITLEPLLSLKGHAGDALIQRRSAARTRRSPSLVLTILITPPRSPCTKSYARFPGEGLANCANRLSKPATQLTITPYGSGRLLPLKELAIIKLTPVIGSLSPANNWPFNTCVRATAVLARLPTCRVFPNRAISPAPSDAGPGSHRWNTATTPARPDNHNRPAPASGIMVQYAD